MPRAGLQAPLQQWFVIGREIDRKGRGRGDEDRQECPALPVIPRASGDKNKGDEEDKAEHTLNNGLAVQRIHGCSIL
jgi:hypothetical protein